MQLPSLSRETLRHLVLTQLQKQARVAPRSLFPRASPHSPGTVWEGEAKASSCFPFHQLFGDPPPVKSSLALGSWRPFSPFAPASPSSSPTLPSCGCPCCRMMSAPANHGAPGWPSRPGYWLPRSSLPPPDSASAAVRCGAAAKTQVGGGGKKKKPYTKNRQPNPPRRQPPFRATTGRTRASSPSQAP